MNMTDEQKNEVHQVVADAAEKGAEKAAAAARDATGWKKALLWIAAGAGWLLAGMLGTMQNSCQYVTPEQLVQVADFGHEAYHIVHPDRECIIIRANEEGK